MVDMTAEAAASPAPPMAGSRPSEDHSILADIVQWDVGNWGRAVRMWDRELRGDWAGKRALDMGAGGGGLTLYLCRRGCRVAYCDSKPPRDEARDLFRRYDIVDDIEYCQADVTRLPYGDEQFDLVAFKSLLAVASRYGGWESQVAILTEAHRVLKKSGTLLFAENAYGSRLHAFGRRHFVSWGRELHYPTLDEYRRLLQPFNSVELESFGVLAAFGRREWQRRMLSRVDHLINPIFRENSRYLVYGYARK